MSSSENHTGLKSRSAWPPTNPLFRNILSPSLQRINILALSRPRLPWQIYENKDFRDLARKKGGYPLCPSIQGWLKPESGRRTLFFGQKKKGSRRERSAQFL